MFDVLGAQLAEPVPLAVGDQPVAEFPAQVQVPGQVPLAVVRVLARFRQPPRAVLAHGVEQPVAARALLEHHGLVHEAGA